MELFARFSEGYFLGIVHESVRPKTHRPGGAVNFLSAITRHRLMHIMQGNIDSDDPDYVENQHPSNRKHSKKRARGRRGSGGASPAPKPRTAAAISPVLVGSKRRRVFITNAKKHVAIVDYEHFLAQVNPADAKVAFTLMWPRIDFKQMQKWRRLWDEQAIASATIASKFVSPACITTRSEGWFAEAEAIVFDSFKAARADGLACGSLWFQNTMHATLKQLYPDGAADDFKAGAGWLKGFYKRFNLSNRVATNVMPISTAERVPQCLNFFSQIQKQCATGFHSRWGKYPPVRRYNTDEVPVEFGGVLCKTAEMKGAREVWVRRPKQKIDTRETTMMPLFCAGAEVPGASIILRATPRRIDANTVDPRNAVHGPTQELIEALRIKYPLVDIYCQPKGYIDAATFLAWFKFTFLPTLGNPPNLLVMDNLRAHGTAEIREFAALHDVCLFFSPAGCTDMVQVTDDGLGRAIKLRMKKYFTTHFAAHMRQWQEDRVTPRIRKQLHVRWLSDAIEDFYKNGGQKTVQKVFGHCGLLSPLDESGPQLRKLKGHEGPIVVEWWR